MAKLTEEFSAMKRDKVLQIEFRSEFFEIAGESSDEVLEAAQELQAALNDCSSLLLGCDAMSGLSLVCEVCTCSSDSMSDEQMLVALKFLTSRLKRESGKI